GTVDGVALTFVTGRTVPQAWLARLPFGLPQVAVGPRSRDGQGGAQMEASSAEPALREVLLTPAVVDATAAADLISWRIERDDLVAVFGKAFEAQQIGHDAAHVAGLVRALPLTELRRHEI